MTRNLKLFIGAAAIFYIIGAVNESVGMYVLAAACLAVILAAYFLTRLQIRGVEPHIALRHPRTRAGEPVNGTITIANTGNIMRTGMSLSVDIDNETVPAGSMAHEFLLPPLPPRSKTEVEVAFDCRARGIHRLSRVRVVANDPIGVYHRWRTFESQDGFVALPRTLPADGLSGWELLSPEGRRAARMLRRSGGDFEGIRPHTSGDDLRQVHWKVTAHAGELVVRQHRRRREAEVTLWVDLWDANHIDGDPEGPTELTVSLAATLIDLFSRGDYLMSVAGHGLPADLSLPSRGEGFLDRALVTLAEAQPRPGISFSEFCDEQMRKSPRLKNVFVVTPAAEPALEDTLGALRQRGAHVTAFLVGGLPGEEDPWADLGQPPPPPPATAPLWERALYALRYWLWEPPPLRRRPDTLFERLLALLGLWEEPFYDEPSSDVPARLRTPEHEGLKRRLQAVGISAALVPDWGSMPRAVAEVARETTTGVMTR